MSDAPVSLFGDPTELKATIAALEAGNARMRADVERMVATARAHEALVQALRIRIARLQRQRFGARGSVPAPRRSSAGSSSWSGVVAQTS